MIRVGERGISLLIGVVVDLGALVGHLDRLTVFVFPLERNLAGLGLPLPLARSFKESRNFSVPGVADRLNLPKRIKAIGLGDLFDNWGARLRPGSCRKD